MFPIVKSLLIVSTASAAIAGIFYLLGYSFLNSFAVVFVSQFILAAITNTVRDSWVAIREKHLENERIKAFAMQGAEVTCSFCNTRVFAPIRLDEDNDFKCPSCDNVNSIYVNITVARSTAPLDADPLTTLSIIDDEEEVKEQLRNG